MEVLIVFFLVCLVIVVAFLIWMKKTRKGRKWLEDL